MNSANHDALIEEVRYGRMTPEEAEAEATRLGLPRMAAVPDPASYNPMGETWWTLVMAIAWISWRSPTQVCQFWDDYRRECWDWHFREWRIGPDGPVHAGHFLEQREPATYSRLSLAGRHDEVHSLVPENWIAVADAKARLWKALGENVMQATGIDRQRGERTVIPEHGWRDLEIFQEDKRTVLFVRKEAAFGVGGYHDVVVRRQAVMSTWPPDRGERFSEKLPETAKPEGPGYMPLYCAAHWIATQGGRIEFNPRDVSVWKSAYAELLPRIASEEVMTTGIREHEREKLGGHLFASCRVDYPFVNAPTDLYFSEELYLCSYGYFGEEDWQRGFDDSLRNRSGVKWSKLMVLKSAVAKWWPFDLAEPTVEAPKPLSKTGAPGRPSSMHLIEAEHQQRWARGEALSGVAAESRALREWFVNKYSTAPPPSSLTIENRIRIEHKRLAGPRN